MFRYVFSSRTTLAALAFFVLVVGGSLLYYWYSLQKTESDMKQYDQALQARQNRDGDTDTLTRQSTLIENAVSTKQGTDTAGATNTDQVQAKTGPDTLKDKSLSQASVSDIEAEIIAEEEKAEEALSYEERRHREIDKRLKEIYKEIEGIVAAAGGKITRETHPVEIQQVARLQKELLQMMLAGNEDTVLRDLIAVTDAQQRFQNRLTADGEIPVSEAFKMANFLETELGNERGAEGIRYLAQTAIDNGSDVITQEHFDAEYVPK